MITSQVSDARNHRAPLRIKPIVIGLRSILAGSAFAQGAMADAMDAIAANTPPAPSAQWVQSGAGTLDASQQEQYVTEPEEINSYVLLLRAAGGPRRFHSGHAGGPVLSSTGTSWRSTLSS
jgi:hypothetical protein